MAVDKAVVVPKAEISPVDVPNFGGGLFLNGAQNAPPNCIVNSKDVEITLDSFLTQRRTLQPFLPDTIQTTFQKFPVIWEGEIYYFTADDGQIVFAQEGDTGWVACGTPGIAAALTTALTGANNDLVFTSTGVGAGGNSKTIAYINAGASKPLVVSVSGDAISIQLATNSGSVITSTASAILAAVNADPTASAFVIASLAPANTGAGVVTAMSVTNLTGGVDSPNLITTSGIFAPIFLRVQNNVLLLNGANGDKLCYVDLTTPGFPVVKYDLVTDPTTAPTDAPVNLTAGAFSIYYAYTYSGAIGETNLSLILTDTMNIQRSDWQNDTASPSSIAVTIPGSPPAGARTWNLYMAIASTGGTIEPSDMLRVASGLDLANLTFIDDGTLSINLGAPAPTANSTDGPRVTQGIVEDGSPILFGDVDNSYNIWIGGPGPNAMFFSVSDGGYLAQPEQGTNFSPSLIVGFRNGQGIPSLTVLYSNTEGLSKQSVLQQQTVNYGDQSFTVWGVTEQHYGAAGVAAPNSAINYNGKLLFLSTDGMMSMNTQPLRQNVISTDAISIKAIDPLIRSIKNSAAPTVVGAGWNNKFMWTIPNDGFDTPQQILVLDTNQKGVDGDGAWYTLDIPAQWIGVVSPQDEAAFVYVAQGVHTYKLVDGDSTSDTTGGVRVPFSTGATGALMGVGGESHNTWQANVQAMFYIMGLVGNITIGVNYRNQNGKLKTRTKVVTGPTFVPSASGGWGDTGWTYGAPSDYPPSPAWSQSTHIDDTQGQVTAVDIRVPIQIDDIMNEAQWFYFTDVGFNAYKIRAVSYEGINLGVRPDLA